MSEAWITLPTVDAADAARRPHHPYNFGFVGAMGRLLMAHPQIAEPFQALFATIMFAPGALDRREREMVAAVAASAQNCFY
jgi:alkylhydroperoxidase/carboxymuconolactone decarboxylase family protein YurZ